MSTLENRNLEQLIDDSGYKINVIAERMGISVNYLWKLRQDPMKMDALQMTSLARALGVSTSDVFESIKNFKYECDKLAKT